MQNALKAGSKLVVADAGDLGRGVFAAEDIAKGEIVEESYYVPLGVPFERLPLKLKEYVFGTPGAGPMMVLGHGMIFNHRSRGAEVRAEIDQVNSCVRFIARRDIAAGEEIRVSYGRQGKS